MMTHRLRKLALTAHITFSVGWLGAVAGFLALSIAGLTSQDIEVVRGAYLAMNLIAWFVIVPMSLAALATGLVQALATEWGLFRYYWVLGKLLLTIFATIVLLMKMPLVNYAARGAVETILPSATLRAVGMQLMVHAAGGILVLFVITTLSVLKPWGRTPYGRRKEQIKSASLISLSPSLIAGSGTGTTVDGLSVGRKRFLVVIGGIVVGFVVLHLIVFHLIGGGLGSHGH